MIAKEQEQSASFRLIACAALALSPLLGSASAMAADNHVRVGAPFAPPPPVIDGETRISAARPTAFGPGQTNYGQANYGIAQNMDGAGPAGRLRLRPMNLGGM